jgi:ABC-type transport system substrate-binding protein
VEALETVPARVETVRVPDPGRPPARGTPPATVPVTLRRPERVKITLGHVDQDLFAKIDRVLGGYLARLDPARYVEGPPAVATARAAELVPVAEHNPVIVFQLRRGVRFHDGHEFDSGDVRFTYETIMDPRNLSPRVPDYEPVKSVEAPDRYTVRITYRELFQPGFESWGMGILPEHLLGREALAAEARAAGRDPATFTVRDAGFNRRPVGTGPFRFVEWKTDVSIRLARFDEHWEGPANFQEYLIRIIPDTLTAELTFYAGTSDAYVAQPHQVARLRDDPRFHAASRLALGYNFIGYNLRRPIFQDVRVRRALGMAIDVDEIIRYAIYGQGERTTGPFPKQLDYYDGSVAPLPYDPEGAARLLAEAGWRKNAAGILEKDGRPFAFTIVTNSGNEERQAVMVVAQNAWRRLGIMVEALSLEWAVFINQRVNKGDFDALVLGWAMGLDPDIYQIFHSSQTGDFQLNFVGYRNARADELMVRVRREYDPARQVEMARELHRLIAAEQPYTFLYVRRALSLIDGKVVRMRRAADGAPTYLPFAPDKLGRLGHYFREWVKTPSPVLPPYRPELSQG